MVLVPRGQSWDEAAYPGRRELLVAQGGSILQLGSDRQGFGGMRVFPGPVAGANISAGVWINVTAYNENTLEPEMCTTDPVTGIFSFLTDGIWRISSFLSVRHNNAGAYREMNARFWNVTDSAGFPPFQIPTGQAATITNFAFSGLYKVPETAVGKQFILQVQGGSGSNYTGVSWETCNLNLSLDGVT